MQKILTLVLSARREDEDLVLCLVLTEFLSRSLFFFESLVSSEFKIYEAAFKWCLFKSWLCLRVITWSLPFALNLTRIGLFRF